MNPPTAARWPWFCLVVAMVWVAIVRVPLIVNAPIHLDSDLAVDGLTLRDALHGQLRWHFPGTPYMGTPPLLLAAPQALVFGASARTITSGGIVAYELVVLSVFSLAWRSFGPKVAAWSLVPMAFASVGTVWLSSRLTGGHLLTVAWFAAALTLLHGCLDRGGLVRALLFGFVCGFGMYLDQMALSALLGITLAAILFGTGSGHWGRRLALVGVFLVGFGLGDLPRELGSRSDPFDAYQGQFATILEPASTGPHAGQIDWKSARDQGWIHFKLLMQDCLPRLLAGHRLPSLATDPPSETLAGGPPPQKIAASEILGLAAVISGLILAAVAIASLLGPGESNPPTMAVQFAMIATAGGVVAGFVLNKNIYNSDNYRYLVLLLVPLGLGFGRGMAFLSRKGSGGLVAAVLLSGTLATAMTLDTAEWYRRFGWIDATGRPIQRPVTDPAFAWLRGHPEVHAIFGGYWDVYRLALLSNGQVRGIPYPDYPDRFDAAASYPGRRPTLLLARSTDRGAFYIDYALRHGGRLRLRSRDLIVIDWPLSP